MDSIESQPEREVCDAICQEWYPLFLRIVFYLELFWTIFPSIPVESVRIGFLTSGNLGLSFGVSVLYRNRLSKRDCGLILGDLIGDFFLLVGFTRGPVQLCLTRIYLTWRLEVGAWLGVA